MLETEKAWLACAIDTDGFVGMKIQKVKKARTETEYYHYSYVMGMVGFSNTDLAIVEEFGRLIDSKVHTNKQNKPYDEKFKSSTVTMRARKIVDILEQVIPYLITKKDRALYVLGFCKFKIENPGDHSSASTRSKKDLTWYETYRLKYPNSRSNRSQKNE